MSRYDKALEEPAEPAQLFTASEARRVARESRRTQASDVLDQIKRKARKGAQQCYFVADHEEDARTIAETLRGAPYHYRVNRSQHNRGRLNISWRLEPEPPEETALTELPKASAIQRLPRPVKAASAAIVALTTLAAILGLVFGGSVG